MSKFDSFDDAVAKMNTRAERRAFRNKHKNIDLFLQSIVDAVANGESQRVWMANAMRSFEMTVGICEEQYRSILSSATAAKTDATKSKNKAAYDEAITVLNAITFTDDKLAVLKGIVAEKKATVPTVDKKPTLAEVFANTAEKLLLAKASRLGSDVHLGGISVIPANEDCCRILTSNTSEEYVESIRSEFNDNGYDVMVSQDKTYVFISKPAKVSV